MYQNYNPYYGMQQTNGITWVQGKEGAKAYQLMPGTNAILMDSEEDGRMYIKICNQVGVSTLKEYEYKEVMERPKEDYITRAEFLKAIEELKGVNNEQPVSTA